MLPRLFAEACSDEPRWCAGLWPPTSHREHASAKSVRKHGTSGHGGLPTAGTCLATLFLSPAGGAWLAEALRILCDGAAIWSAAAEPQGGGDAALARVRLRRFVGAEAKAVSSSLRDFATRTPYGKPVRGACRVSCFRVCLRKHVPTSLVGVPAFGHQLRTGSMLPRKACGSMAPHSRARLL